MTLFMQRVAEYVGAEAEPDELPRPAMSPSVTRSAIEGADRLVAVRSYAEQLVCEANAVLEEVGEHMSLVDEVGQQALIFAIHYRGRQARVTTEFNGHSAWGQIVGDGLESSEPMELEGPDSLPDLIMLLLMEAGVAHSIH